jgi:hypothetical protein
MFQLSASRLALLLLLLLVAVPAWGQDIQPATPAIEAITGKPKASSSNAPETSPAGNRQKQFAELSNKLANKLIVDKEKLWARELKPVPSPTTIDAKQGQAPAPSAEEEAQELAKKLANPVASLISVPLQSNFDFRMGAGAGWRYTLNVQPVIPVKLSPNWNLISRTIVPFVHQGNVTGPRTSQSGLGDITQSLFFSPNKTEPFIWAVGPVFLVPTATNAALGTQKFGIGPTVLVLKQQHGWTIGFLGNHIWSVAGKSSRAEVNSTFVQPFVSYSTKDAWTYGVNTESTYDWNGHAWAIPIIPSVSKLVRFGKQPVSFGGGVKCWVTTPSGGPESCSVRIIVTALFPKK